MKRFVFSVAGLGLALGLAFPAHARGESASDPVLYYTFDTDEGGIVSDASGNGRTATVNGATWVADGMYGGAYRFDSKTQTITATDAGLPSGDAPRSATAWMKLDANYDVERVTWMLSYGTAGFHLNDFVLGFDWRLDRDQVFFSPGGSCFLSERKIPLAGTWIHVAYTYGGNGDHHLYIDGVPSDGMSELGGPVNTILSGVLLLGGHPESIGPDGGYLDDVRIYDRVLSPEEIAELAEPSLESPEASERTRAPEMKGIVQASSREDGVEIRWASIPGQTYEILWTPDLKTGFSVIDSGLVATGTEMVYLHLIPGDLPKGFFGIRLQKSR